MSRYSRIIGAQAAAVALLVLIVYMTLLRPESDEPLRGISTPGSEERAEGPADQRREKPDRHRDHPRGDGGKRTEAPSGGEDDAAVGLANAGGPPLDRVVTPPTDQYADAVAALLSKVASAPAPDDG